jgi:hypothetical protein
MSNALLVLRVTGLSIATGGLAYGFIAKSGTVSDRLAFVLFGVLFVTDMFSTRRAG